MVSINSITKEWHDFVMDINAKLPKNKLLKFLISACWGVLSETNTINKTEKEINDNKIDIGNPDDHEYDIIDEIETKKSHYYVLLNSWQPYKHNLRLKPFLTAYGRNKIGNMAYKHLEHVVRIHTDCIVTDIDIKYDDPYILPEDKSTGYIHFHHNNCYKKIDAPDYNEWLIENKIKLS